MRIKENIAGIFCCVVMLCLFVCCPVLAEESPDGQTPGNGQSSVSGEQMEKTAAQNSANTNAGGDQTGEYGTDGLRKITGTVTLSDDKIDVPNVDDKGNGYTWTTDGAGGYVLTLKNVCITGDSPQQGSGSDRIFALKVPAGKKVTIKTEGRAVLEGGIQSISYSDGSFNLVFDGARLKIDGVIVNGTNGDQITVQGGADVEITQRLDLGGSANENNSIFVTGQNSKLTIGKGEWDDQYGYAITKVTYLQVTDGGWLIVNSPMGVFNGILLDESATIEINGTHTFYAATNTNSYDPNVLNGIISYLPSGYRLGEVKVTETAPNGTTERPYYTVLKPDGTVATSLILKWLEEKEPTTAAPEEPTTAVPEEPTTAAPEEAKPDTGNPEAEEGPRHNDAPKPQAAEQEPESEPETEPESETEPAAAADSTDDTGSKVVDATPYTGDRDGAGLWAAFAISSAAALCLAVPRLKSGRSRR